MMLDYKRTLRWWSGGTRLFLRGVKISAAGSSTTVKSTVTGYYRVTGNVGSGGDRMSAGGWRQQRWVLFALLLP